MTELQLYKFINNNDIEWHKLDNDGVEDIIIFLALDLLQVFNNLTKTYCDNDGGLVINLKDGYVAIWMNDLCEYYDIDVNNVFTID